MRTGILFLSMSLIVFAGDESAWTTYGKNQAGWRYSELKQIDARNIKHLAPSWIFQTHAPSGMETTPLVQDGIMYVTGTSNHAWAVDLKSGKPI